MAGEITEELIDGITKQVEAASAAEPAAESAETDGSTANPSTPAADADDAGAEDAKPEVKEDPWEKLKQRFTVDQVLSGLEAASKTQDYERNAKEALRTANERNREAGELTRDARAREEKLNAILETMTRVSRTNPELASQLFQSFGNDAAPANADEPVPPAMRRKLETLEQTVTESNRALQSIQMNALQAHVRGIVAGVVGDDKSLGKHAKTRDRVVHAVVNRLFTDPKFKDLSGAEEDVRRAAREVAKEEVEPYLDFANAHLQGWREERRATKGNAALSSKGSVAPPPAVGAKVPKYNGRNLEEVMDVLEKQFG